MKILRRLLLLRSPGPLIQGDGMRDPHGVRSADRGAAVLPARAAQAVPWAAAAVRGRQRAAHWDGNALFGHLEAVVSDAVLSTAQMLRPLSGHVVQRDKPAAGASRGELHCSIASADACPL